MRLNYPNYPKHIIGKSNFKKIDNVDFLKHRGFFIGRTTSLGADSFSIDVVKESFAEGREVNRLVKQFDQTRKMMKMVTGSKMGRLMSHMPKMPGGMPGMPGMPKMK